MPPLRRPCGADGILLAMTVTGEPTRPLPVEEDPDGRPSRRRDGLAVREVCPFLVAGRRRLAQRLRSSASTAAAPSSHPPRSPSRSSASCASLPPTRAAPRTSPRARVADDAAPSHARRRRRRPVAGVRGAAARARARPPDGRAADRLGEEQSVPPRSSASWSSRSSCSSWRASSRPATPGGTPARRWPPSPRRPCRRWPRRRRLPATRSSPSPGGSAASPVSTDPAPDATVKPKRYRVKSGDTLSSIAARYDTTRQEAQGGQRHLESPRAQGRPGADHSRP